MYNRFIVWTPASTYQNYEVKELLALSFLSLVTVAFDSQFSIDQQVIDLCIFWFIIIFSYLPSYVHCSLCLRGHRPLMPLS